MLGDGSLILTKSGHKWFNIAVFSNIDSKNKYYTHSFYEWVQNINTFCFYRVTLGFDLSISFWKDSGRTLVGDIVLDLGVQIDWTEQIWHLPYLYPFANHRCRDGYKYSLVRKTRSYPWKLDMNTNRIWGKEIAYQLNKYHHITFRIN